jgi:PAS domain S-box-containing protein
VAAERDIEIALCVFREANDALIIFDPRDRRVVDVNPTTLRLTGFERKAAVALKFGDLITSPDPNDFKRLLSACLTTGFFHSQEGFLLTRMAGSPIPVNVSVSRIHTRPEPLGLAIIRDISARKKVESRIGSSPCSRTSCGPR